MNINDLRPAEGSKKRGKRVARGQASGTGTTAGKGNNGQNSRSGGGVRLGFEGGQLPLYRRLPKRGFSNFRFKTVYTVVNLDTLSNLDLAEITPQVLLDRGVIKKLNDGIKVLGDGELDKAITVKAHKFSKSAAAKIEEAGGKAEVI